jgi:hypothetical protein
MSRAEAIKHFAELSGIPESSLTWTVGRGRKSK